MMRFLILLFCFSFAGVYAVTETTNSKKAIDVHVDHPDHVPHNHGGKDPVKKVTQDEIVFPRKKKKKI
jgi:hypothetical protein